MRKALWIFVMGGLVAASPVVWAEPAGAPSEKLEQLKKLKEENPQAFKEAVQKHRTELRADGKFKAKRPCQV